MNHMNLKPMIQKKKKNSQNCGFFLSYLDIVASLLTKMDECDKMTQLKKTGE